MRSIGSNGNAASAVILEFPVPAGLYERLRTRGMAQPSFQPAAPSIYEGAWYHGAAVEEERRADETAKRKDH